MARTDILDGFELSLTLDRYQEIMRIPEAAFNGLYKIEDQNCADCDAIWRQSDRDGLALALKQAEDMREKELGYFLSPKYTVNEYHDYAFPCILDKKHLISLGTKKQSTIQLSVPITLFPLTDPITITVTTSVTDVNEIFVYYPGEDIKIKPSSISISSGTVTIKIPRSRLVKPSVNTNCEPAPDYIDNTNFLTTVDIKREYTDVSEGLYRSRYGTECCDSCSSTEVLSSMFAKIEDYRLSILQRGILGTYSNGSWTLDCCTRPCNNDRLKVNYLSGLVPTIQLQIETARLAHTLLPSIIPDRMNLCSHCWKGDYEIDENNSVLTPYGAGRGAVAVWMTDSRSKVGQGGKFPNIRKGF